MKGVLCCHDKIFFLLRGGSFYINIIAKPQYGYEHFNSLDFSRMLIYYKQFFACIIHERFIPSLVLKMSTHLLCPFPTFIFSAKMTVGITIWLLLLIFRPEIPFVHPHTTQLLFHFRKELLQLK